MLKILLNSFDDTGKMLPTLQRRIQRTDTFINQECGHECANRGEIGCFHNRGQKSEPSKQN